MVAKKIKNLRRTHGKPPGDPDQLTDPGKPPGDPDQLTDLGKPPGDPDQLTDRKSTQQDIGERSKSNEWPNPIYTNWKVRVSMGEAYFSIRCKSLKKES